MKDNLKALIVDDERLARKELISMLKEYDIIQIIGEADNIASAAKEIESHKPHVIFLDIQMPGGSGFDLLNQIDTNARIVFVTAFDEFAIRAFEVNALDYLLKPINPKRLNEAIERLSDSRKKIHVSEKLLKYSDKLFLLLDSDYKFINVRDIKFISANGDYTELGLSNGNEGITLKTMKEWEKRLPSNNFCRIHRSTIINIEHIDRLEEWFNYSFKVHIKGKTEPFVMSRRYAAALKDRFS